MTEKGIRHLGPACRAGKLCEGRYPIKLIQFPVEPGHTPLALITEIIEDIELRAQGGRRQFGQLIILPNHAIGIQLAVKRQPSIDEGMTLIEQFCI